MGTAPFSLFAIAAPGLEPIVARELAALGESPRPDDGGVSWTGDARSLMRANLWLRSASRVLVRVAEFRATAFFELEKQAKRLEWERWLGPGVAPEFRVTARKSKLYHSDAIAERLLKAAGSGPWAPGNPKAQSPRPKGSQLFVVRFSKDLCTVSADSSGALLHLRGYRQAVGKAPLRETLAAALLLAAEWSGDTPLVDPFCGSGTIPIEAALLARRLAPGRRRDFAFQRWPAFDGSAWAAELAAADATALAKAPARILGSDRDTGAVDAARANAERAGVSADVELGVGALSSARAPVATKGGLLATNPPYGKRVGGEGRSDVRDVYAQLGHLLRRHFGAWRAAFYAADERMARQLAIHLTPLFRTTNGGLKVTAFGASVADSAD